MAGASIVALPATDSSRLALLEQYMRPVCGEFSVDPPHVSFSVECPATVGCWLFCHAAPLAFGNLS